jgi:hypothetical protein
MPALEYAVRPYQTPNAQNTTLIPSTPSRSTQRATLVWGAQTNLPAVNTGVNFNVVCCREQLQEKDRDSDDVDIPIQDSGDGNGHVTVSRPNTVRLQKHDDNNCDGLSWDQFSGVGAEISSALDEFAADVHSGTAASAGDCHTTWKFKNQ